MVVCQLSVNRQDGCEADASTICSSAYVVLVHLATDIAAHISSYVYVFVSVWCHSRASKPCQTVPGLPGRFGANWKTEICTRLRPLHGAHNDLLHRARVREIIVR